MKKALAWLLVIAMTAAISIGGTLAYLTDTDEDVNAMTVGQVKIDQLEYERIDVESADDKAEVQEFHDNKPLYPAVTDKDFNYTPGTSYVDWEQIGKDNYTSPIWDPAKINNEVDKMVFVKNKGDWDAYVRTVFAFEAGKYTNLTDYRKDVHLNLNETDWSWNWVETPVTIGEGRYFIAIATYDKVLAPGAITEISLSQIALDSSVTNEDVAGFGKTYQVLVKSQAIQSDGFTDSDTALNEGFGAISANTFPWTSDSATMGIDLRTALYFLDGNPTGTKISGNISKVVYALNSEYPEIVNAEKGTLVDIEQDVDVHAYYVQQNGTYTVYFLSNGTIYSPANSADLYANMGALVEVDTHNYDVSRVETMSNMFLNCKKLAVMDTSNWNTGNVTNMFQTFRNCNALVTKVGGWNVSNVTNMYGMFAYNYALTELDVSKWQVGKVEDMAAMFAYCYDLLYLDVAKWDTGSVKTFKAMFQGNQNAGNMKINNLDMSNWDTSSCTIMNHMFYSCGQLKEMNLANWDVSNVTTMSHMFADCFNLEAIDVSGWVPSSCKDFDGTFNDCVKLKYLDTTKWDTGSATTLFQMFEGCRDLKAIDGIENWDVSNVTTVSEMFNTNSRGITIESLDLSGWNTASLTNTWAMFNGCSELTTIYVGDGWDMSKVPDNTSMFSGCGKLVGANGTTYKGDSVEYACVDTDETPGYLTYKAPATTNP